MDKLSLFRNLKTCGTALKHVSWGKLIRWSKIGEKSRQRSLPNGRCRFGAGFAKLAIILNLGNMPQFGLALTAGELVENNVKPGKAGQRMISDEFFLVRKR